MYAAPDGPKCRPPQRNRDGKSGGLNVNLGWLDSTLSSRNGSVSQAEGGDAVAEIEKEGESSHLHARKCGRCGRRRDEQHTRPTECDIERGQETVG